MKKVKPILKLIQRRRKRKNNFFYFYLLKKYESNLTPAPVPPFVK